VEGTYSLAEVGAVAALEPSQSHVAEIIRHNFCTWAGVSRSSARFSERDWIDPPKTTKSQAMVKHISKGNQAPVKVLYVDASQNPPHLIEVIFSKFIPFSMDLSRLLEE
jgi:hypothetical protein